MHFIVVKLKHFGRCCPFSQGHLEPEPSVTAQVPHGFWINGFIENSDSVGCEKTLSPMSSSASLAFPNPSAQHCCLWWGFAGHLSEWWANRSSGAVSLCRGVRNIFVSHSALSYFRSQLPAFTHRQVLADWGVLPGMVKVTSALSESHPKSEEVLVWPGQSSWCGWEDRLGRYRKAGEVIAALLVKWKEILTGLCEIHCCCPWRAPKAPPSLHRGRTLQQQLGNGEQFLKGCVSPGVSEEVSSSLYSSATSPWQILAFCSQLTNPLAPLLFSLNLELELTGRHNFLCTTLCCLPDVLLHVSIHRSEGNIALRKS